MLSTDVGTDTLGLLMHQLGHATAIPGLVHLRLLTGSE